MDVVALGLAKADAAKKYLSLATMPRVSAIGRRGPRRHVPPLTITAAADAPTITYPTATVSSITSAKAWTADPAVTGTGAYVGCVVGGLVSGRWANLAPSSSNGVANDTGTANNQRAARVIKRDLMFDGVKLEVDIANKGTGYYRVRVDDTYVGGITPTKVASDGANHLLTLDFTSAGGAKPRRIRIELQDHEIKQFWTGPTDTLWTPTQRGPVIGVIGDSYSIGSAQGGSGGISTWPSVMGDYLGADAVYNMSIGGTGVLATNNATFGGGPKYRDRLAPDLTGLPLDILIIGGTHNDTNGTPLQTEMQTLFTACRAQFPNAVIIMTGPFSAGSSVATYTAHMTTINAAVAATPGCVDFVIDTITQPWFTGTGKTSSLKGDGNSDIYIGPDSIHPVEPNEGYGGNGILYLGRRIASAVQSILQA